MAGDKEQLVSMGFDPARVDCELTLPCMGREADDTRVIEGDAQFRSTGQLNQSRRPWGSADDKRQLWIIS